MATAIFTDWFQNNAGSLDVSGREIGLTLFTRCPVLSEDGQGVWGEVNTLDSLLADDHWQAPSYFAEDATGAFATLQQEVAATAPYFIDFSDGQYYLRFEDQDTGFVVGTSPAWGESVESPSGIVINGLAIWYDGSVGDVVRPLLVLIQLDRPVLLMATDAHPTLVKAPLVMSWSTPTPGVRDSRYGLGDYGTGTYGGGT